MMLVWRMHWVSRFVSFHFMIFMFTTWSDFWNCSIPFEMMTNIFHIVLLYSCPYIRSLITYSHLTHSHLHFWIMIASMDICVSPKITPPVSWFRFYQNVLFIPKYLAKQFNVCHTSFYWPFALIKVKVKNSDCGTFKEEW